jgi:hypothetical protein
MLYSVYVATKVRAPRIDDAAGPGGELQEEEKSSDQ